MSAGPPGLGPASDLLRRCALALLIGIAVACAMSVRDAGATPGTESVSAVAGSGPGARAGVRRRCRTVRVELRRNGEVVTRRGEPVLRRVRRCRLVPSPGCRFVKVRRRLNGKVLNRLASPRYLRVERCPHQRMQDPEPSPVPAPAPSPGPLPSPPSDLAALVLARPQHVPGDVGLFSTLFYPDGPAMVPAAGPQPTEAESRQALQEHMERRLGDGHPGTARALALFDDADVASRIGDPTLRAAFAAMAGTLLEPAIDDFLDGGVFTGIAYGATSPATLIAQSVPDPPAGAGMRKIVVNDRYDRESFTLLIAVLGHEIQHSDASDSGAEEAILGAESAMAHTQVLSGDPALAYAGTELTRRMNDLVLAFRNSRHPGSPESVIVAPDGLGTIPESPNSEPDLWSLLDGSGSTAAPAVARTILGGVLTAPIPDPLSYDQATAELFESLGDGWLTDVQRVQVAVLLQLVTVDEIVGATGLTHQQVIDALGLEPYIDAVA